MNNPFFLHVNNHANVESERALRAKFGKLITNLANGNKVKIASIQRRPSYTFAGIIVGNEFHIGAAICHPNDQFCKKIGRAKAEGRAKSSNNIVVEIPEEVIKSNKTGKFFADTCRDLSNTLL